MEPLRVSSILDMAYLAKKVAEGTRSTEEFFRIWTDLSPDNDRDVIELWYEVGYLEIDREAGSDGADFYRGAIVERANLLESRYKPKWDPRERNSSDET